jgi:serine/threonine protein kinase
VWARPVRPSTQENAEGSGKLGPFKRYGRYTLIKKLATGGMAEIWLSRQRGLADFKRFVVVKKILSHLGAQETFVRMFLDEARMSAQLNHPNIVQVYDLGKEGESYFIAMEFINGENLASIAWRGKKRNKPIPVHYAARILADACKGLHYAHLLKSSDGSELNIVHRDISPQNLLVTYEGETKVVDFGIAKAASRSEATKTGMLKGKFSYMSPEQCLGSHVDMRSDVFALGIVLYELTTGTRLFKHESELMILEMITKRDVVAPREVNPDIPPALDNIIMKALRKDLEDRFQNAQEMQLALEEYMRESGRTCSSNDLAQYQRTLFADHIEEKQKILELASRDDIQEVDFDDESTERAGPARRIPQVQIGPASPSQPQYHMPTPQGMMVPPHATASPGFSYPASAHPSAPGYPMPSGSMYYPQPYPVEDGRHSWVARSVIIGALLVIAFASYVLYRQLTREAPVVEVFDTGVQDSLQPVKAGTLKLETSPPGAKIVLDGQPMKTGDGSDARTPSDLQGLAYGRTFEITFEKEGYKTARRSVLMGNGTDSSTIDAKLQAFDGTLRVEVGGLARDATVIVNDEEIGQGPVITKSLPGFQQLLITARHPSFKCTAEPDRLVLEANKTQNVVVTCNKKAIGLGPVRPPKPPPAGGPKPPPSGGEDSQCSDVPGRATIGTKPEVGARVFVNGKEIGTTPINGYKLPSNCTLKLRLVATDGREKQETIKLSPNVTSVYIVPLE